MKQILAVLSALPALIVAGTIGVDFSSPINAEQAECLASQGEFAVLRAFNGSYGPDKNSVDSYNTLSAAGVKRFDYYHQTCRPYSPN